MRLRKPEQSEAPAKHEPPTRRVSFMLEFGEAETLKTIQEALTRARCLGVPDDATVTLSGGSPYLQGSRAHFSWKEAMG